MSPHVPQRRTASGPRYYRLPPLWGLIFLFALVVVMILFLRRLG